MSLNYQAYLFEDRLKYLDGEALKFRESLVNKHVIAPLNTFNVRIDSSWSF